MADSAVRFSSAAVRLGGRTIWQGVDLDIGAGEFVAILGPNGAGKSTLLRALLGVLSLTEGSVEVFGRQVKRGNADIGYLPQRRRFDPGLRIRARDLVQLGLDGAQWGTPLPGWLPSSREKARRVSEIIELVGATAYAESSIGDISGGEQQRILIAQALVGGAKMLALDEPLDSLDLQNQQSISSLIQRLCRERGITVLLVAHDVNPMVPYIDRVVFVARGRVVSGSPDQVINTETLTRLYDSPVEVLRTSDGRIVVVGQQEPVSYHAHEH